MKETRYKKILDKIEKDLNIFITDFMDISYYKTSDHLKVERSNLLYMLEEIVKYDNYEFDLLDSDNLDDNRRIVVGIDMKNDYEYFEMSKSKDLKENRIDNI